MVTRMAGPEDSSACELSRQVGVSHATLSRWLREARSLRSMTTPENPPISPRKWSPEEKLRIVAEARQLSPQELGAYLRNQGVHAAQLQEWMRAATEGLGAAITHAAKRTKGAELRRIRELERELRRKDAALAEVTALLALQKKVHLLWGDADDPTATRSGT